MRVMFVTGSLPPMRCGVGDYTHRLAAAIAALPGQAVAVLTSRAVPAGTTGDGVEVFPIVGRWRLGEAWRVFRLFRLWRPDLVHVQYPTQAYGTGLLPDVVPLLARLAGARVAQTWHEPIARREVSAMLLRRLAGGPVVVVRPRYLELLHRFVRALAPADRMHFIASASAIPRSTLAPKDKAALRLHYLQGRARLVVYFGFLYRHKGVDLLFDVADPQTDRIVIAGDSDQADYKAELQRRADSLPWSGNAKLVGFLPAGDVADLLSVADAVVLPFRLGGGEWNTSIHGAIANDAYVITTSTTQRGYDAQTNVHFAAIDSAPQMREALALAPRTRAGVRSETQAWPDIAAAHVRLYTRPPASAAGPR